MGVVVVVEVVEGGISIQRQSVVFQAAAAAAAVKIGERKNNDGLKDKIPFGIGSAERERERERMGGLCTAACGEHREHEMTQGGRREEEEDEEDEGEEE
ncbi:unnamed protein product [Pleuronectes platessa]|uniref:Uncharacterized protein n=1 Tax=Pleuronectes platessa TaxID=8262 RepID=A0A9N7TIB5_PLEPL|nr:unnamed protein product [Pleuronectes platessa]